MPISFDLEWFEKLTDEELTFCAMSEACLVDETLSEQQRDLIVALVNRIARYNPEIERHDKTKKDGA